MHASLRERELTSLVSSKSDRFEIAVTLCVYKYMCACCQHGKYFTYVFPRSFPPLPDVFVYVSYIHTYINTYIHTLRRLNCFLFPCKRELFL